MVRDRHDLRFSTWALEIDKLLKGSGPCLVRVRWFGIVRREHTELAPVTDFA